jgi:hypothetical protein
VWAGNNVWHISRLRIVDINRAAGSDHTIFVRTVRLGLYLSVAEALDLW